MDEGRFIGLGFAGDNRQQPVFQGRQIIGDLLVGRLQALLIGHKPELQEVHFLISRRIHLRMDNSGSGGHSLNLAAPEHLPVPGAVLVLELPLQHNGHNLHFLVGVGAEALQRSNKIIVKHPERTKIHIVRITVFGKGKAEIALQPSMVCGKSAGCRIDLNHL
ncbi:hypothetical protein D3C75_768920 [compost metagenome]